MKLKGKIIQKQEGNIVYGGGEIEIDITVDEILDQFSVEELRILSRRLIDFSE